MDEAGAALKPVHEALLTLAAQGKVIHNDDTTMRVQTMPRQEAPVDEPASGSKTSGT